jgi:hypothetical protein
MSSESSGAIYLHLNSPGGTYMNFLELAHDSICAQHFFKNYIWAIYADSAGAIGQIGAAKSSSH